MSLENFEMQETDCFKLFTLTEMILRMRIDDLKRHENFEFFLSFLEFGFLSDSFVLIRAPLEFFRSKFASCFFVNNSFE